MREVYLILATGPNRIALLA